MLIPKSWRLQNKRKANNPDQSKVKSLKCSWGTSGEGPWSKAETPWRILYPQMTAREKHPPKKQASRRVNLLSFDYSCPSGTFFWLVLPIFRAGPPHQLANSHTIFSGNSQIHPGECLTSFKTSSLRVVRLTASINHKDLILFEVKKKVMLYTKYLTQQQHEVGYQSLICWSLMLA